MGLLDSDIAFFVIVTLLLFFFFYYIFVKQFQFSYVLGFEVVFLFMAMVNAAPIAIYSVELELIVQISILLLFNYIIYSSEEEPLEDTELQQAIEDFENEFDVEEFGKKVESYTKRIFNKKNIRNTLYKKLQDYNVFTFSRIKKKKKNK